MDFRPFYFSLSRAGETKRDVAAHIALLCVQFFFGTSTVLGKNALAVFHPFSIVAFRIGIAAVVFATLQRMRGTLALSDKKDYLRFALFSIFGISVNQLLFFAGLHRTTAVNTSLIAVTIPIFAFIVSIAVGNDRSDLLKWSGVASAALGVLYLIGPWRQDLTLNAGDFLILLNSFSYAIYVGFSKKLIARNGALKSITWLFIFGSIIAVPLGGWELSKQDLSTVSYASWGFVAGLVLFPTILAYYWNAWALARVQPSMVAVYVYLQPIIGFLSAVIFLKEEFTARVLISAALVFLGVFLVTTNRSTRDFDTDLPAN